MSAVRTLCFFVITSQKFLGGLVNPFRPHASAQLKFGFSEDNPFKPMNSSLSFFDHSRPLSFTIKALLVFTCLFWMSAMGMAQTFSTDPPNPPTVTVANNQVTLTTITALGGYPPALKVKRGTSWDGPYTDIGIIAAGDYYTTSRTFTDNSAVNGTTYYYVVANYSGREGAISAVVAAQPGPSLNAPAIVRTELTGTQARISWTVVSSAVSYNLKRSLSPNGPFATAAIVATIPDSSAVNSGLTPDTTYYYVVSAVNASNVESPNSTVVAAIPSSKIGYVPGLTLMPADKQVTLNWQLAGRATSYLIKRRILLGGGAPGNGFSGVTPAGPWIIVARTSALTFTDINLVNGTTYNYAVSALANPRVVTDVDVQSSTTTTSRWVYDEGGESSGSATPGVALTTPTTFVGTAGDARANFTWSASAKASTYLLKRSLSVGGTATEIAAGSGLSFSDTGLTNGTTYYYTLTGVSSTGTRSAETTPLVITPNVPLASAAGFTATGQDGRVFLNWSAVSGATAYWVYRAVDSSNPAPALIEKVSGTSFVDTTVQNGTTYYYTLRTSKVVTGSEPLLGVGATASATPIGIPASASNLKVTAGDAKAQLLWDYGTRGSSYEIWWQTGVGVWAKKTTLTAAMVDNPPSTVILGLTNGTLYSFFVRSVNSAGASADSNPVSVIPVAGKPPEAPNQVGIGAIGKNSMVIFPPKIPFGAASLNIYYASGNRQVDDVTTPIAVGVTNTNPITVSNLSPGQTYTFRALAINNSLTTSGPTSYSQTLSDTAPAGLPTVPTAPFIGQIGYGAPQYSSNPPAHFISVYGALPLGGVSLTAQWKLASDPVSAFDDPDHQISLFSYGYEYSYNNKATPLSATTAYAFRLKASNDQGSVTGPTINATTLPDPPAAPPAPVATATSDNSITFTVPALPARAIALDLRFVPPGPYYTGGTGDEQYNSSYAIVNVAPGSVTVPRLSSGSSYQFWWVAKNAAGKVAGSVSSVTTTSSALPPAPAAPIFQNLTETSIEVVTLRNLYSYYVNLTLQIKVSGTPDASYQTVAENIPADALRPGDTGSPITITPVAGLTPGQVYVFRYIVKGNSYNSTPDVIGPTASVTLPTVTSTWSAGPAIACPGIRYPRPGLEIRAGTVGKLTAGGAFDWDLLTRTINGQGFTRPETDTCIYTWTATAGTFPDGNKGETVRWQAPTGSGNVTFGLTVTDQGNTNKGIAETGARNDTGRGAADAPLNFSVTVQVIP